MLGSARCVSDEIDLSFGYLNWRVEHLLAYVCGYAITSENDRLV